MTDFSTLQTKVDDLKAKVAINSITPLYLGSLLDDIITQMEAIDMTGMSDDVRTAMNNAAEALRNANSALTASGQATTAATNAGTVASSAYTTATQALTNAATAMASAASAVETAETASNTVWDLNTAFQDLLATVGSANGIAPLDANGRVPAVNLPGYVDDVVEIYGLVKGITVERQPTTKMSTDEGCRVYFDRDTNQFVLGVETNGDSSEQTPKPMAEVGHLESADDETQRYVFYDDWADRLPRFEVTNDKIYVATETNQQYRWSGTTLTVIGSSLSLGETPSTAYPGDKGKQLAEELAGLQTTMATFSPLGNDYNVTNKRRETNEMREVEEGYSWYDTLESAVAYAMGKGVVEPGMHLTFATAPGVWMSYVYVGMNKLEATVTNATNWQDLAGLSAGTEAMVNLNVLVPNGGLNGAYSLNSALMALRDYETQLGRTYRKLNLVITYRTGDGKSEAKQYKGDSLDETEFYTEGAWEDFGKGSLEGIKVNGVNVEPMPDGTVNIEIPEPVVDEGLDPISTHAVANAAVVQALDSAKDVNITTQEVEGDADNGYKLKGYNAKGEVVSEVDLPAGGGGGGEQQGESTKIVLQASITDGSEAVSTLREGSAAILQYVFGHQYSTGDNAGQETGADGTVTVTVKSGLVTTFTATYPGVTAGPYTLDISSYLRVGNNAVTIQAVVNDPVSGTEKRKQVTQTVSVRRLTMSSTYDLANTIRGGGYRADETAAIPFACQASGKKDIHVVLDGVESPSLGITGYAATSGEVRIPLTGLTVGRHNVQIYATQALVDLELQSETLYVDLLKAPAEGGYDRAYIGTKMLLTPGSVMLGEAWREPTVETRQYTQLAFDFVAYDPEAIPALVRILHGGELTNTISARRTTQTYTNRFKGYGRDEMRMEVGDAGYNIHIDVVESAIDLAEVTDSVVLDLRADGRSNGEANPGEWAYGQYAATFVGMDWLPDGSGWTGESLRLLNGASVSITPGLLSQNATMSGATIECEVKVTNVTDKEAKVVDVTADGTGLAILPESVVATMDGGESVNTKMAVGKWYRVGLTVAQSSSARRLMTLYMNGVEERVERFEQSSAMMCDAPTVISSEGCDLEVRMVRKYGRCLTKDEMLDNYMAGQSDTEAMVVMFTANDILDIEKQRIEASKLRQQGKGVLIIKGSAANKLSDLNFRNDKKYQMRVNLEFFSPYGTAYDFTAADALINIQGTSSVTYPRKNYDIVFDTLTDLRVNGIEVADKLYAFKPGARPVGIFCLKADYSDSSGTHNTGAVKTIDQLYRLCGWLTPPQAAYAGPYDVRTAIDSFPITVFNDNDGAGETAFIGKYNFNNEKKDSGIVYGFEGIEGYNDEATLGGQPNPCVCLEFLDNSHAIGLFQTDDLAEFDKALEFRFPTNNGEKVKWAQARADHKAAIQALWTWVVSCRNNPAKFLSEIDAHFLHKSPFAQYAITDYFMAVDDRVKNMMLVSWDLDHWMFIPYDWDCLWGDDNTTHLSYDYDIDWETYDQRLENYAFAGHGSLLWELVRACPGQLADTVAAIRSVMSTTMVKAAFSTEYNAAWCERVYNYDQEYKYIDPAFVDIEQASGDVYGDYLFGLKGQHESHRDYMIDNRFALLDSLYGVGDFRGNAQKVYMFGEFSTDPRDIVITAYEKFGFGYSSNNAPSISGKVVAEGRGDRVTLTIASDMSANDPQNIYGADRIEGLDLSGIADKLVATLTLSACSRLRDLDMHNGGNEALEALDLSGNRVLRTLDVDGMRGLRTLDLSRNRKLASLQAADTRIANVTFATGAVTTQAHLPSTVQSLVMVGMPNLTLGEGGLESEGWANVATLHVEQMGSMNPVELLKAIVADQLEDWSLSRVRIGGESTRGDGSELLALLDHAVKGVTNDAKPEVNGVYQLDSIIEQSDIERIEGGIEGVTLVVIIDAYVNAINEVNGEMYGGMEEVENITTDNIAELALRYYNGETYEEWLDRYTTENANINTLI